MNEQRMHPYITIIIGVIAVSMSAIFVKLAAADSGITAFYRMFFSVVIMTPIFLWKYINEVKKLTKRDWSFSIIAGIFLAFHFILWFESLKYTSVASSTVLVTLQPLFAFAGTYFFFKEKLSIKTILSAMLAITGSIVISWGDFQVNEEALYGDMLALIACALVTAYLLFGQDVRRRLSLVTYTYVVYLVSTIVLLIYVLGMSESFGPYSLQTWCWFVLLAIVPNLLGHTMFNYSIKFVSTNAISMAILFEPVGAAILAYFIFMEYLTFTQVIGAVVVLIGIALFIIDEKKFIRFFFRK
ncbi:DMT family transporter [Paenisporosarcina cavernae]|uniref:DMT family transporter n=1 Tax=Paenisporosarcina cavernae TaxID=2320858 RepID=A0A385YVK5_9BACL|nr:DMT family transporter [Paenisporosarcina cavernae]AYC29927.1 DMT family transporter [Paenisporosarcina cavernae]